MSEIYSGPIRNAADAKRFRAMALQINKPRIQDAAKLLAPDRWRMVAARPGLAQEIVDAILWEQRCSYCGNHQSVCGC